MRQYLQDLQLHHSLQSQDFTKKTLNMATSSQGITEEENNYIRIFYLLHRVSPSVVREKFDSEFYPGGLKTELNTNRFNILLPLFNNRVIHQKQWDLLYPVTGKLL